MAKSQEEPMSQIPWNPPTLWLIGLRAMTSFSRRSSFLVPTLKSTYFLSPLTLLEHIPFRFKHDLHGHLLIDNKNVILLDDVNQNEHC